MLTQLFEGVNPLSIDEHIAAACRSNADENNFFPGGTKGIAILNTEGQLYRVIGAQGHGEASRMVDALTALGLLDRLGFDNATLRVTDTITGKPVDTRWSAVMQEGRTAHAIPALLQLNLQPVA